MVIKQKVKPFKNGDVFPVSTQTDELRYWLAGLVVFTLSYYDQRKANGGQIMLDALLSVTPPPQMPGPPMESRNDSMYYLRIGEPGTSKAVF